MVEALGSFGCRVVLRACRDKTRETLLRLLVDHPVKSMSKMMWGEWEDARACSRIACVPSSHHTRTTAKSSPLLDSHDESRAAFLWQHHRRLCPS